MDKIESNDKIVFGPVPSRRLDASLGINNIPPKICSYSCIYCQIGKTNKMMPDRNKFYKKEDIFECVRSKLKDIYYKGGHVDYLTYVPDGEPTLDSGLGKEIELLSSLGIKIAVITNSSLLAREDVREDLYKADLVSVKIDSIDPEIWKKINRPHKSLNIEEIKSGIIEFSIGFKGLLLTETMLVKGYNDNAIDLNNTANFIKRLNPQRSYISVPIRPPAEKLAQIPNEENINLAYQIFKDNNLNTELLLGYEGNDFFYSDNLGEELLSIVSVHPMRDDAINSYLTKANSNWKFIESLIKENKIREIEYKGHKYYLKKI
ncbi:MAG: molybdenum cofactor biosynthesis protein A [Candidatus Methanofastidiosum methylothiophilum]|uniref:Molybdenum cofactor biosynthesis protein A n=1 Tax=Candidatus Methanofastidiosum methylothiophilum TaxID=1705564 RepID=A0A150IWR8_9EURY|nr:MAG: molybdenum cofactor biosynthesis protein A [Candidatus Methanofastidiosum methylthiophilus]